MKKIIAVLLSALILCSAAACSSDSASFEEIDPSKLPSKVDLRDFEGKNYVTPVKGQLFGDCWSFSLTGSAEIAYLFANDMGVPAGEKNDQVNYSEKYVVSYMYHGITKDDVVKGRVRASQVGEGFDLSEAEEQNENIAYFIGGPYVHNANLFGAGFGPVDESVSLNGELPYAYNDEAEVAWNLPANAEYRNAPTDAFIRNSFNLPELAGTDDEGNYKLNTDALNAIKSELCKGHGVSLAYNASNSGMSAKKRTAYYNGDEQPNHAVTVVGYDDDFPKENFSRNSIDGELVEDSIPPENGAFIIKNSWGLTAFDGDIDDGYFYLSYYDHSIVSPLSYEFDSVKSLKHSKVNIDQYDMMMTQWYVGTEYDAETKTANVFDAEEDESLYQIGFTTALPRTEISYEIYKDVEEGNPSSGTLLEKGVSRQTYTGYHKVDLKGEYALKAGDKYSVVLTMKTGTDAEDGGKYVEVFPYSLNFFEGMTVRGIVNKGESYLYSDGKWSDMTGMRDSLIDRAYEQGVDEIVTGESYSVDSDKKGAYTIDNYPIKAISAPAGKTE